MDTEGGDLLWREELVVVDKAKAEKFESTIHHHYHPNAIMSVLSTSLRLWRRRSYTIGQQLTLLISSHA